MDHKYITHETCDCYKRDSEYYQPCMVCDGGLAICSVCGLMEGSITTDCPGEECWAERGDDIYTGKLDYREGEGWVNKKNPTNQIWDKYRVKP